MIVALGHIAEHGPADAFERKTYGFDINRGIKPYFWALTIFQDS